MNKFIRKTLLTFAILMLSCSNTPPAGGPDVLVGVAGRDATNDQDPGQDRISEDLPPDLADIAPTDIVDDPADNQDTEIPDGFVDVEPDDTLEIDNAEADLELWDLADDFAEEIADLEPELPPPPCTDNEPCDDLDPCTTDDWCDGEVCQGNPYQCDDGRACTLDTCDGLGNCEYTLIVGKCLINGICAKSGEKHPDNQCKFCNPAKDSFAWSQQQFSPCNDGNSCTVNDHCFDGSCLGDTAICSDDNPCTTDVCNEEIGCLFPPANIACDDGDPCSALDFCEEGECKGGPAPPCGDDNPCTLDFCQSGKGCFYMKLDDLPCDDENACTVGDMCIDGACLSGTETPVCDDWNDCTDDVCDFLVGCVFPLNGNPCCINDVNICDDDDACTIDTCNVDTGQCIYLPNEGSCTDANACTENDACTEGICLGEDVDCDDDNPCTLDFCHKTTGCIHEGVNAECDDDSVCTLNDQCQNGLCTGLPLNCNDYNLCTTDSCDPVTGCHNDFSEAPCDDLDLCTANDTCLDGICIGTPKTCDDSNVCTNDSCDPNSGCQNLFSNLPCDDLDACTDGDHCQGGVCIPGEVICVSCDYEFGDAVNRVAIMQISTDAKVGHALDLNNDGKMDNSMAGIGGLANDPLQGALDKGDVHLLMEHHELKTDGNVYPLGLFVGELGPGFEQCDFSTAYCGYVADEAALDAEDCVPMVLFDNASIFNGKLVAGGQGYQFPWQIPLSEETMLDITLFAARIEADVVIQGGLITAMNGIIGGAIPKASFLDAIDAVPAEQLPLPKDMIVQLIQGLVINDIDTDGNGAPDAASIAIQFEAIAAGITGLK
jgi:hypothetical protein